MTTSFKEEYRRLSHTLSERRGIMRSLQEQIKSHISKKNRLVSESLVTEEAILFLGKVSDSQIEEVTNYLQMVTTMALQSVFGEDFRFLMEWDRGKTNSTIQFYVESPYGDTTIKDDPRDARGGGLQNIVDFSLWMAILSLTGNNGPVCMDEPWAWVSKDNLPTLLGFLGEIQTQLGWQVFLVSSHVLPETSDVAETVFHVTKENGISQVVSQNF